MYHVQRLLTVGGGLDVVFVLHQLLHQHQQVVVVLDDEHRVGICPYLGHRAAFGHLAERLGVGHVYQTALGHVVHDEVLLVNLLFREGLFVDGQLYHKGGALAFDAVAVDVAAMQIDQVAGQRQTQAGADGLVLAVVAVVEAGEQPTHLLFRYAVAVVTHAYDDMVVALVRGDVEHHLAVGCRIFGGIRQQVEDDLVQLVGVYPTHHALRLAGNGKLVVLAAHQGFDAVCRLGDVAHHVAVARQQLQLAGLRLAGFQYLLQQTYRALDVHLHQVVLRLAFGLLRAQVLDGCRQDGERGEQLVGDVGEDITHLQLVPDAHAAQVQPSCQIESDYQHEYKKQQ